MMVKINQCEFMQMDYFWLHAHFILFQCDVVQKMFNGFSPKTIQIEQYQFCLLYEMNSSKILKDRK